MVDETRDRTEPESAPQRKVFRADFDVRSDLTLPAEAPPIVLKNGAVTIKVTNQLPGEDGHVEMLNATVIGPATSLKAAANELRELLADSFDLLTFATHSRFRIVGCRRALDWTPGPGTRAMILFRDYDARFPPSPELSPDMAETARALESADLPYFAVAALRSFRLGCIDRVAEDQFRRFFTALEIVAENVKNTGRRVNSLRQLFQADDMSDLLDRGPAHADGQTGHRCAY